MTCGFDSIRFDSAFALDTLRFDSYSVVMAQKTARHNGFAVRDFRIKAGLSTDELAQRTLISAPHIRNIENEIREPNLVHLHKIAEVLGVRPVSLVRDPSLLTQVSDVSVAS